MRVFLALVLALIVQGCGGAQKSIVGKWRVEGGSDTVWEFRPNGVLANGDQPGRYKLGDGNRLKIETRAATYVQQVEINGDHMTWKAPSGSRTELVRQP